MGAPIRYGRTLTTTVQAGVVMQREEVYANLNVVKEETRCYDIAKVADEKEFIAEFLNLIDRFKAGEIDLPGIQLLRNKETGALRVEKTWTIP